MHPGPGSRPRCQVRLVLGRMHRRRGKRACEYGSYTTAAPPLLRIDNPTRLTRLQACLCDLFTPNCTLAPLVSEEAQAAGSTVTSGARKCKRNAGWRSPAQPAMHPCTPPGPAAVGYLVLVS